MQEVARFFSTFLPQMLNNLGFPIILVYFQAYNNFFFALKPAVQSHFTGKRLGLEQIFISQTPFRI